jgi:hypothetical protein
MKQRQVLQLAILTIKYLCTVERRIQHFNSRAFHVSTIECIVMICSICFAVSAVSGETADRELSQRTDKAGTLRESKDNC